MKKISLVSLMSFIFLITASITTYFLKYVSFNNTTTPLFIGLGTLIASGLFAILAKKIFGLNIICFILSAIAFGFCIRTWYIFNQYDNSLLTILLVSLACIAYLWIFYLLAHIPIFEKHFTAFFWSYIIVSFILYILTILLTKTTYVSTFGFYMLIEMAFIFALCYDSKNIKELIRAITISTYSVFIVIIIILLLLSNGDFDTTFDGLDINKKKSLKQQELEFE